MPRIHPPREVLDAFDVDGEDLVPLPGGQERSWRAGDVVLKPVNDPTEAEWVAEVLSELPEAGFRVSRPTRSRHGRWIEHGWSVGRIVDGVHDHGVERWPEVLDTCRAFHSALAAIDPPAFVHARTDPWSIGDRAAWGTDEIVVHEALRPLVERLRAALAPIVLDAQVIHGDLAGNVLYAPGLAPAVIDFCPYVRPADHALAIVVNDAVAWFDAPWSIADHVSDVAHLPQLLRRAAIYRLVTSDRMVAAGRRDDLSAEVAAHARVADLADALE